MRQVYDTGRSSPTEQTIPQSDETDDEMTRSSSEIEDFHKRVMNSVWPNHVEDPTLSDPPTNHLDMADADFEDDDVDENQNADSNEGYSSGANQPLYPGAKITLAASMILLISFAMRHALTGEALADLLVLIEVHCLTPNLCETIFKTFKDFFRNLKSPLQFHFYCEKCFTYHGEVQQNSCPNCHHPTKKNSSSYFLVIPIILQLSSLFADGTFQAILEQKRKHQRIDREITDIMDGQLYKEGFDMMAFSMAAQRMKESSTFPCR